GTARNPVAGRSRDGRRAFSGRGGHRWRLKAGGAFSLCTDVILENRCLRRAWASYQEATRAVHSCGEAATLAHCQNRSAPPVSPLCDQAAPMTRGGGAGAKGISLKRGPAVQVSDCGATATPAPASTAAIKLLTLSCSSAMRGFFWRGANRVVNNS